MSKLDHRNEDITKIDNKIITNKYVKKICLENNAIKKIENLDICENLFELSLATNKISKITGLIKLSSLTELNLSHNNITCVEGLKSLGNLCHINLSHNSIKKLENLAGNFNLVTLNISWNEVYYISNISFLSKLKEIDLSHNKLKTLSGVPSYLPKSVQTFNLSHNLIEDLTNVYYLSYLTSLRDLSIVGNSCLVHVDNGVLTKPKNFNYRPYVISWCMKLRSLDKCPASDTEILKAEWLYSQGKVRNFKIGDHANLVNYLLRTCPTSDDDMASDSPEESKLKKVLNHQKRIRSLLPAGTLSSQSDTSTSQAASEVSSPAGQGSPGKLPNSAMSNSMYITRTQWNTTSKDKSDLGSKRSSSYAVIGNENESRPSDDKIGHSTSIIDSQGYQGQNLTNSNHARNGRRSPPPTAHNRRLPNGVEKCAKSTDHLTTTTSSPQNTPANKKHVALPDTDHQADNLRYEKSDTSPLNLVKSLEMRAGEKANQPTMQTLLGRGPSAQASVGATSDSRSGPNLARGREAAKPTQIEQPKSLPKDDNKTRLLNESATRIQALWRGHSTRNDPRVVERLQCLRLKRIEDHINNINVHIQKQNDAQEREVEWRTQQMNMLHMMWAEIKTLGSRIDHICLMGDDNVAVSPRLQNNGMNGSVGRPDVILGEIPSPTTKSSEGIKELSRTARVDRDIKSDDTSPPKIDRHPHVPSPPATTSGVTEPSIDELEARVKNFPDLSTEEKSQLFRSVTSTINSLQENIRNCLDRAPSPPPHPPPPHDTRDAHDVMGPGVKSGPSHTPKSSDYTHPDSPTNDDDDNGSGTIFRAHDSPYGKGLVNKPPQQQPWHTRSRSVNADNERGPPSCDLSNFQLNANDSCPLLYPQVFDYLTKSAQKTFHHPPGTSQDGGEGGPVRGDRDDGPLSKDDNEAGDDEEEVAVSKITDDIVNSILLKAVNKYSDTKTHRSLSDRASKFLDLNLTEINLSRNNKLIPSYSTRTNL